MVSLLVCDGPRGAAAPGGRFVTSRRDVGNKEERNGAARSRSERRVRDLLLAAGATIRTTPNFRQLVFVIHILMLVKLVAPRPRLRSTRHASSPVLMPAEHLRPGDLRGVDRARRAQWWVICVTTPITLRSGTGPQTRESHDSARLSPITK